MTKLLHLHMIHPHAVALPPYISPSSSLSSQSPSPYNPKTVVAKIAENSFFHSFPVPKNVFDIVTLSSIAGLLLLALIAFAFIVKLQLRSRTAHHLQKFNSLWILRSLLVLLASLWAVNEILRLPILRKRRIYPFLASIALEQQDNLCKLHAVLSLGFFEPAFLITLFFLINASINKINTAQIWSVLIVLLLCSPIVLSQIFIVYFSPFEAQLPRFMHRSSVLSTDFFGNRMVLCTYPFLSFLIFAVFAAAYAVALLLSCWRLIEVVINKRIGRRINVLAATVTVTLAVQMLCLSLSALLVPENVIYGCAMLAVFLCIAWCMAVGVVVLVVKPVRDSLAAGGDCCRWSPGRRAADDREQGLVL